MPDALSVWAGGLIPAASLSTDIAPNLGAKVQVWSPGESAALSVSAEWLQVEGVAGEASLVSLLVSYQFRSPWRGGRLGGYRFYGGPGVGIRYSDEAVPEMKIDQEWMFAWQAAVGVEWRRGWLVEACYLAGQEPGDDGLGGLWLAAASDASTNRVTGSGDVFSR